MHVIFEDVLTWEKCRAKLNRENYLNTTGVGFPASESLVGLGTESIATLDFRLPATYCVIGFQGT